jgi:hypothetical protein
MLTYLNDTADPRNAYPDYWGLSSEREALSTIGREGYCINWRCLSTSGWAEVAKRRCTRAVVDVAALVTAR